MNDKKYTVYLKISIIICMSKLEHHQGNSNEIPQINFYEKTEKITK